MEAATSLYYGSSKSSGMGDSENSLSSMNSNPDSAQSSIANKSLDKASGGEDCSTFHNAALHTPGQNTWSTRETETLLFQLTQDTAMVLHSDLHGRWNKWSTDWKKNDDATVASFTEIQNRLRLLARQRQQKLAALLQRFYESCRVMKELERMLDTAGAVHDASDFIGVGITKDERLHAAHELAKVIDDCVYHERMCWWLKEKVIESSEDLVTIANSWSETPEIKKPIIEARRRQPGLDPLCHVLVEKNRAYARVINLIGGTKPKATSKASVLIVFAIMKKHMDEDKRAAKLRSPSVR